MNNDEFFEKLKPIIKESHNYLYNELLPKYIAHYINSEYKHKMINYNKNISQLYHSILEDLNNLKIQDIQEEKVKTILQQEYNLKITSNEPINIQKTK